MKRKQVWKTALAAVTACTILTFVAACGEPVNTAESTGPTVSIGVAYDLPDLGLAQGTSHSGFDVDVARYVAHKLGYANKEIVWKQATTSNRAQMIVDGTADLVVDSYAITPERSKTVDFAGPYLITDQRLLVRKDDTSLTNESQLPGKSVCVAQDSQAAQVIEQKYGSSVRLVQLPDYAQCTTALLSGPVDAVSADDVILYGLAQAKGEGHLKVIGASLAQDKWGIAVKSGSPHLVAEIDDALHDMVVSGAWKDDLEDSMAGSGYKLDPSVNPPKNLLHAVASDASAKI